MKKTSGRTYIIGAGPGDPGLITVKGMWLLGIADSVVYDHLINQNLLEYARPDAEKVNVGKQVGRKLLEQEQINKLLIREARKGKIVVRLKGGDPFVFGRGGEEAEALSQQGIPFEVVPGVTSAIAAPAYAGIPLTHRGLASSAGVFTGHEDPAKAASTVNFKKIAQSVDTLVCLMGVGNMDTIIQQVRDSGRPPETPVAIVERGTCFDQRVLRGTLKDILPKARRKKLKPPSVIIVGEVVNLRRTINWFESLPLFGKTVVVTRAKGRARSLIDLLEQSGAKVIPFPTIEFTTPGTSGVLDKKINHLKEYDYLVFTSVHGVKTFLSRMHRLKRDLRSLSGIKIAALGEMTARVLKEHFLYPEVVPEVFTSRHLADKFKEEGVRGKKLLLVRSEIASDILPEKLRRMGANVDEVSSYTVRNPRVNPNKIKQLFKNQEIDLITFTSPSTFANFISMMKGEPVTKLLKGVKIAAIGPVTKKEITAQGIRVAVSASHHTVPGLVDAIIAYYQSKK